MDVLTTLYTHRLYIFLDFPIVELKIFHLLIYEVRGHKAILDSDLSLLYGVLTKNLNKAVKRNLDKFPPEFMFQLTNAELEDLRFQFGTTKLSMKKRFNPYVFTEHGVLMTANILNSDKAK